MENKGLLTTEGLAGEERTEMLTKIAYEHMQDRERKIEFTYPDDPNDPWDTWNLTANLSFDEDFDYRLQPASQRAYVNLYRDTKTGLLAPVGNTSDLKETREEADEHRVTNSSEIEYVRTIEIKIDEDSEVYAGVKA